MQVPLGTNEYAVIDFINNHETWTLNRNITYAHPIYSTGGKLARTRRVHMGTYHNIFRVDVVAFWRFDDNGNLFELIINKQTVVF